MCVNLIVYIISIIAYAGIFTLVLVYGTSYDCQKVIAQDLVYSFTQMTFCSRIIVSCYMNLRYSRPFEEVKKQFVLMFTSNSVLQGLSR